MENGDVGVQVQYKGEPRVFSAEQIMAMLLTDLKHIAQANLQSKVTDCVISVPSFYTDFQRRALLRSAQISGLNCLKIMNETSAVALNYGLFKQDLPAPEENPRHVVFVDMGHSALQVTVAAFNKGKIKILATASDPYLGGRDFDAKLQDYFANEFQKKYKIDARSNTKAWIRLGTEVEKIKKQMSSNTGTLPLSIECLMNDIDVTHKIDRATFEEMCKDLFIRLEAPMVKALAESGLKQEQIDVVETVGGSTRIPFIKTTIESIFNKPPSTTLNQDEAVSRGCAIQCAMLSHTVKVRDIEVLDAATYPINISWDSVNTGEPSGEMEVFKKHHAYPFTKLLTFPHRIEPFRFQAFYHENVAIPHNDRQIGEFIVNAANPSDASCDKIKVKVKVRLDKNGCFTVSSASMVETLTQPPPEKEEPMDTSESAPLVNGENKENSEKKEHDKTEVQEEKTTGEPVKDKMDDEPMKDKADDEPMKDKADDEPMKDKTDAEPMKDKQPEQADDKRNGDKTTNKSDTTKPNGDKKPEVKKPKKLTKSTDLTVTKQQSGPTQEELNKLIESENEMIFQVRMEKERSDAKNAVEEYIYEMKYKIFDIYEKYISETDRTQLNDLLSKAEDWLYDEGDRQSKQVYVDKLAELKKPGQLVVDRYNAHKNLPDAFEKLGSAITHYRKILDQYGNKDEKYLHIEEAEMKKVHDKVDEKFNWFNQKLQENGKCPTTENPSVYPSQVQTEIKLLQTFCDPIVNKPKPKAEPPKDQPKTEKKKENDTETTKNTENTEAAKNTENTEPANETPEENMDTDPTKPPESEEQQKDLNMEVD